MYLINDIKLYIPTIRPGIIKESVIITENWAVVSASFYFPRVNSASCINLRSNRVKDDLIYEVE